MYNIERDEQRIKEYYCSKVGDGLHPEEEYGWFTRGWFEARYAYIGGILDLSEEFFRNYCEFFDDNSWFFVFNYQTNLSDQFYDDFFDKIELGVVVNMIKNNGVSLEWIERNKHRIPPEVWSKVYE